MPKRKTSLLRSPWLWAVLITFKVCMAIALFWVFGPMAQRDAVVDLSIEPGTSVRGVAEAVAASGVDVSPHAFWLLLRISGQSRQLRAGSYEVTQGTSPWQLMQKLVRGDQTLRALTVVEGWTLAQMRRLIDQAEGLRHDTQGLSDDDLMARLGRPGVSAEGRFFPDTYTYGKGTPDWRIYERALKAMDRQLARAWQARTERSVLPTPEQALVLASIIEKETGQAADRAMISSVFHNRLRLGMPLQTDPTVIYGLGSAFDGNLKRIHLRTDHPWNTYTRNGLPPTPIALPGKAALWAAVQPAQSKALYFVARGDGSSQFSDDLAAHNAAVERYQLRRRGSPVKAQ
ncbi:MAG: hypothetical protein RIT26_1194 [Pseudomonadota bacterium]|jgi:UPF0755 protein